MAEDTEEEKEKFWTGILIGFLVGFFLVVFIVRAG